MSDESLLQSVKDCLENTDVGDLGVIFSSYCKNVLQLPHYDRRKKDRNNRHSWYTFSQSYHGNKIECGIYGDNPKFLGEILYIVLRKRAGHYIIIGENNCKRFVEWDGEVRHYDPDSLRKMIAEHPVLFERLGIRE